MSEPAIRGFRFLPAFVMVAWNEYFDAVEPANKKWDRVRIHREVAEIINGPSLIDLLTLLPSSVATYQPSASAAAIADASPRPINFAS